LGAVVGSVYTVKWLVADSCLGLRAIKSILFW
jgi:hypothetical protein